MGVGGKWEKAIEESWRMRGCVTERTAVPFVQSKTLRRAGARVGSEISLLAAPHMKDH